MRIVGREETVKRSGTRPRSTVTVSNHLGTPSLATVRVSFLNGTGQQIGDLLLPTVGPREREDKTGLLPVESRTRVPSGARTIRVDQFPPAKLLQRCLVSAEGRPLLRPG